MATCQLESFLCRAEWISLLIQRLLLFGPTKRADSFSICLSIFNLPQRTQGGDGKRRRRRWCWRWGGVFTLLHSFWSQHAWKFRNHASSICIVTTADETECICYLTFSSSRLEWIFFSILPHQKRVLLFWSADGVQHTSESNQSAVSDSARSCLREARSSDSAAFLLTLGPRHSSAITEIIVRVPRSWFAALIIGLTCCRYQYNYKSNHPSQSTRLELPLNSLCKWDSNRILK